MPKFFCRKGLQWRRLHLLIFLPKLSSFIDWCCYYTQVSYTGSWEPLVEVPVPCLEIIYLCVGCIDFAFFNDFKIVLGSVAFYLIHVATRLVWNIFKHSELSFLSTKTGSRPKQFKYSELSIFSNKTYSHLIANITTVRFYYPRWQS